ncbi:hypothetical protein D3C72_1807170 [compost metagenome]
MRCGDKFNPVGLAHTFEQRIVDVGTVRDRIRIAEALAKGFANGDVGHGLAVDRIDHHHVIGVDGMAARALAHAKRVKGGEGVGAELHASANFADDAGLLQHLDMTALTRQRERRRKASDAATDDEHRG